MRRARWIIPIVLVLVAIGAHTVYRRMVEQQLRQGVAAWLADRRAAGWTVSAGPDVESGWPMAVTLTVPTLMVHGGEADLPGGMSWTADRLALTIDLLHPAALHVLPQGAQSLRIGRLPTLAYTAEEAEIVAPLQPNSPAQTADITLVQVHAGLADAPRGPGDATIATIRTHVETQPAQSAGDPAVTLILDAATIQLPPARRWPLGGLITSLSLTGTVDGPVPPLAALPDRAKAWRDGGGQVVIRRLGMMWGPLTVSAAATASLDGQLQPVASANARLIGYDAALDALDTNGFLPRRITGTIKTLLALIAQPAASGEQATVDVPLSLQDQVLSVRQIPLMRVPPLVWTQ